jgi:hypothetical protein
MVKNNEIIKNAMKMGLMAVPAGRYGMTDSHICTKRKIFKALVNPDSLYFVFCRQNRLLFGNIRC